MTGCQCTCAGWCERHQVRKSETAFQLCKTNESYFVAWEEGRGPGQKTQPAPSKNKMPPLAVQAWNLATAIADFAKSGFKLLSVEEYTNRLTICDSCTYRVNKRCSKCGCGLQFKVRAKAFKCPAGKWNV